MKAVIRTTLVGLFLISNGVMAAAQDAAAPAGTLEKLLQAETPAALAAAARQTGAPRRGAPRGRRPRRGEAGHGNPPGAPPHGDV